MKKINWDSFANDSDILDYLRGLPRYKNTMLKSGFSRAKFFLGLLYCRLFKIDKPLFIILVTNNTCNLKCTYCYGKYGQKDNYRDFSTIELLRILDELKDLGMRLLTMHGGESLLRKDIGEIINYAKLKGFYISFNTNGYMVPARIDDLKCLDAVVVSLDGNEVNNDKNRGKGCFNKAMEAIDLLIKNNIPVVISATMTKDNVSDIELLGQLAKEKKSSVQFSILYNEEDLKDSCEDVVLKDHEIRAIVQKILDAKNKGLPVFYSDNVLKVAINWPNLYNSKGYFIQEEYKSFKKNKLISCYHGKLKYYLDADGRVVTCWAHNIKDAPNIRSLGVTGAIKKCRDNNKCMYCAFLSNNEQNARKYSVNHVPYVEQRIVLKDLLSG